MAFRTRADPSALLEIVRTARAAALADIECPHCGGGRLIRWGGFAGRQRHRCKDCGRTFSDFTGTPAAYCKRVDLWPAYAQGMVATETVRRSAARLQVARTTAFRWRHRILAGLLRAPDVRLAGRVELSDLCLRHSEKGSRRLHRAARRRGGGTPLGADRVIVLFASSAVRGPAPTESPVAGPSTATPVQLKPETAIAATAPSVAIAPPAAVDRSPAILAATTEPRRATFAELVGTTFLTAGMLRQALRPRLAAECTIVGRGGTFNAYRTFCNSARIPYEPAPSVARGGERRSATALAGELLKRRYLSWVATFRGVATRYLAHYLRWFRFLDDLTASELKGAARLLIERAFTRAVVAAPPPPSPVAAGT